MMKGKPVVLFNRIDKDGTPFWDPFVKLLEEQGVAHLVQAVTKIDEILPAIESARESS